MVSLAAFIESPARGAAHIARRPRQGKNKQRTHSKDGRVMRPNNGGGRAADQVGRNPVDSDMHITSLSSIGRLLNGGFWA